MSVNRDVLLATVSEIIIFSGLTEGKPRGTANRLSEEIVDGLFQIENWEALNDYFDEVVDRALPDRR